jgi:hypothetical protein
MSIKALLGIVLIGVPWVVIVWTIESSIRRNRFLTRPNAWRPLNKKSKRLWL